MRDSFWRDKRVLITGHTGFKGSWLSIWLSNLGAKVRGIALPPDGELSLFNIAKVATEIDHCECDIRDFSLVSEALCDFKPEIIFHLAAQPLVRKSYTNPAETYATNVMGTLNVLEASRRAKSVKAIVNVTTDKCYENTGIIWGYRENETLGGHDPYSSSKACVELLTNSYRRSFLSDEGIAIATARAGNVIGGGDWSEDRLVPDVLRSIEAGANVYIRNPNAVRPWQHVLEPLSGYMLLAEKLYSDRLFEGGWNFGPRYEDTQTVSSVVKKIFSIWGDDKLILEQPGTHPHEADFLKLDITKANKILGWFPTLTLDQAIFQVVDWHRSWLQGADMKSRCVQQIFDYSKLKDKSNDINSYS